MPSSQSTNLEDVNEVLHAIDSGNESRCRRTEREIRNALQNDPLTHYHRARLTALLGLLTKDWREAEHLRIRTAEAYTRLRSEAAVASPKKLDKIDSELRHTLLSRLNAKQEANAPPSGLTSAKVPDELETRRFFRAHGFGHRFAEFKKYPERIVDHKVLRRELEKRVVGSMREEDMEDSLKAILLDMFSDVFGLHDSSDDEKHDEARVWEIDDEAEEKLQKKKAKNRQRNLCRRNKEKAKKADAASAAQQEKDTVTDNTTEPASERDATIAVSADSTAQPKLSKRQKKTLLKKARQAAAEPSAPDDTSESNGKSVSTCTSTANGHHDSKDKNTQAKKSRKKSKTKDGVE